MNTELICLIAGPIIALLVQVLKKVTIIWKYPKVTALVLSLASAFISGLTFAEMDWSIIASCVLGPFAAAVATYEVLKTAKIVTSDTDSTDRHL